MELKTTLSKLSCLTFIFGLLVNFGGYAQIRMIKVDPANNEVTIQNFGSSTKNITGYRFCSLFDYAGIESFTVTGDVNLATGASVIITGFSLNNTAADLGLFLPSGGFGTTAAMVDFLQWGSAGNGREGVANSKGIWTTGDFITFSGPFFYNGSAGTETGVTTWSQTLSTGDLNFKETVKVSPNPFLTQIVLNNVSNVYFKKVRLFDTTGRKVKEYSLSNLREQVVPMNGINSGLYFLHLTDNEGKEYVKKLLKK